MTLLLGRVCSDGTILVTDSKGSFPGRKPTYDKKKIFTFPSHNFAIAVAGSNIEKYFPGRIAELISIELTRTPDISLDSLCEYIRTYIGVFLIDNSLAKGVVLVANPKALRSIDYPSYVIGSGTHYEGGVDLIKHPLKEPEDDTTDAYAHYFKSIIRPNMGETVGGKAQVVVLK